MTTHNKNFINTPGKCNHQEHKKWNRRSFLQALGIAGGGTMAFANTALSVSKPSPLSMGINNADNDRILVLIRLKGGNDGLSTIVPIYDYDTYANARPTIKIPNNNANRFLLNDDFGMSKAAIKLENMWGDGQMKVAHGVGYDDSSLSHFKGSDIWATTDPNDAEQTGWMGRYFQELYPDYLFNPPEKPTAIQIGSNGNLIFNGQDANFAFSVANRKKLFEIAQNGELYDLNNLPDCTHGEKVGYLKGVANATFKYAGVINEAYDKTSDFGNYPDNKLSKQLSIVSRLIKGDLGTKVYLVTLEGFDTHNDSKNRHSELMTQLSETISYFYDDLKDAGLDDKVLSMTISEFGRRVKENGSKGTDHGTASPSMFFGTALEGNGFIGEHPDMSDLNNTGNFNNYSIDFRQLYATVLKEWLCVDAGLVNQVLLGQEFESLDLGFNCSSLSIDDPITNSQAFNHIVTYSNNQSYLHITNSRSSFVDIKLYNFVGQEVATLKNEMLFEGEHIINIKEAAKTRLNTGQYVYRISTGKESYSKSVMIL